jgi:hypothetical protein
MRREVTRRLDRVDHFPIGSGRLEAFAFIRGGFDHGKVGGAVDYSHRLNKSLSMFGSAEAGAQYGNAAGLYYQGLIGIRKTLR